MRKTLIFFFFIFVYLGGASQQKTFDPKITLKWAPTGLVFGNISLQGEYSFGRKKSLTAKISIPVKKKYEVIYDENNADMFMKALSFLSGYRMYLSKQKLKGFYIEPYFKYVHHTSEGVGHGKLDGELVTMNFTNEYNAAGMGVQFGTQFIIAKRFVIDLFFLGPEINSATNNFKAIDVSNSAAWNTIQASEAEADIIKFLDQFPFVRSHVNVRVDQPNRTVTADFKGALPGIRTGVSIGIAL